MNSSNNNEKPFYLTSKAYRYYKKKQECVDLVEDPCVDCGSKIFDLYGNCVVCLEESGEDITERY